MFGNYMKIMLRNILRHKSYSVINIMGLAIGIVCCLLIISFIFDEFSYEDVHENRDNIYRVTTDMALGGREAFIASSGPLLAENLEKDMPEIMNAVRFFGEDDLIMKVGNNEFKENEFWFTDSDVFDTFTIPLDIGDPSVVLKDPFSVVISRKIAAKYFGTEDPLGKILSYNGEHDFVITGVLKETNARSQLNGDFYASFASIAQMQPDRINTWSRLGGIYTFLHLPDKVDIASMESKINELFQTYVDHELAKIFTLRLQPFNEIYLYSDRLGEITPKGNIQNIYLFSALALAIILIASINFVNLTTARFSHRSKEVGVRKVFGANRTGMIRQFIGESLLLSIIAMLVALVLFELAAPMLVDYFGKELSLDLFGNYKMILSVIGLCLLVGVGAGIYPAFFLSGFEPVAILKGETPSSSGAILRKLLVVFQFSVSIVLIISIIVIYSQLDFMKNSDLGFDKEGVLTMDIDSEELMSRYTAFKNSLLESPYIESVCASPTFPSVRRIMKSNIEVEGRPEEEETIVQCISTDYGYIESLNLRLKEGRDFSREIASDTRNAVIINERAAKFLDWEQPLGKEMVLPGDEDRNIPDRAMTVIGVVKDFHILSLDEEVEPMVIYVGEPGQGYSVAIRIDGQNQGAALASLRESWDELYQGVPLNYSFVSDAIDAMYEKEDRLGEIMVIFSILAASIGALGLFGLISFSVEKRTKEIGIRKVMGATVVNIIYILARETAILVVIANIIAWPLAYYVLDSWLENFAYHIEINMAVYLISGIVAFFIAMGAISFQAIGAAYANPAEALKYE